MPAAVCWSHGVCVSLAAGVAAAAALVVASLSGCCLTLMPDVGVDVDGNGVANRML